MPKAEVKAEFPKIDEEESAALGETNDGDEKMFVDGVFDDTSGEQIDKPDKTVSAPVEVTAGLEIGIAIKGGGGDD